MIYLGPKTLLTWRTFISQQLNVALEFYVSIGILPGKVRRNSMKTKPRVLDANLDPGRSPTHLSSRLVVPDASCLQRY